MINLTEILQKIKLRYKWRYGRNKVMKRYEKIMRNFPQPPICAAGEDFELYTERVAKHLVFICRCMRLNRIAIKRIVKESIFLEKASKILHLITIIWFVFVLCWCLMEILI